jgi:hypothetical protein
VTSKAGYWIGGGLIVFAVVVAVLWAVIAGAHLVSTIDDFQRVTIPGTKTVQLGAHKVVLYVEGPAADQRIPPVRVLVTDARTGTPLPIRTYGGSLTYSFHRTGAAQATVAPTHAGAYRVRTSSDTTGYEMAIGDSIASKLVATIAGAFVLGGLFGIAGIVMLVVTGVRRSRRRTPPRDPAWPMPPQSPA